MNKSDKTIERLIAEIVWHLTGRPGPMTLPEAERMEFFLARHHLAPRRTRQNRPS